MPEVINLQHIGRAYKAMSKQNTIPGFFFVKYTSSKKPVFFSYRRHVLQVCFEFFPMLKLTFKYFQQIGPDAFNPYKVDADKNQTKIDDIRIIGENSQYVIGYVLAYKDDNGTISCSYAISNNTIQMYSRIYGLFTNVGMFFNTTFNKPFFFRCLHSISNFLLGSLFNFHYCSLLW